MAKNKNSLGKAVSIGAGVAAVTAAAYVLFGPEGKENRKKIKGWVVKMKGEIIEKLEEAKDLSEPIYHEIVNEIAKKYHKEKNLNERDIEEVVRELRSRWKAIVRDAQGAKSKQSKDSTSKRTTKKPKSSSKKKSKK